MDSGMDSDMSVAGVQNPGVGAVSSHLGSSDIDNAVDEDREIEMDDHDDDPRVLGIDYISFPELQTLGIRRSDYQSFPDETVVERCVRKVTKEGGLWYETMFADGHLELIPFERLLSLEGGAEALEGLGSGDERESTKSKSMNRSRKSTTIASYDGDPDQGAQNHRAELLQDEEDDEQEEDEDGEAGSLSAHELRRRKIARLAKERKAQQKRQAEAEAEAQGSSSEDELQSPNKGQLGRRTRSKPLKAAAMLPYRGQKNTINLDYDSDEDLVVSDIFPYNQKPKPSTRSSNRKRKPPSGSEFSEDEPETRKSGRAATRRGLYAEPGLDDDFMDIDSYASSTKQPTKPRVVHAKEIFPSLDEDGPFVRHHSETCDTCGDYGHSATRGDLVYCQGCSYSYHADCIGARAGREHIVTKIDEDDFVLQCKRCVGRPRKKDPTAPHTDRCVSCRSPGASCSPFRDLLQKPRGSGTSADVSSTATPDVEVPRDLLYKVDNHLFRCTTCRRAWHFEHLPPLTAARRVKTQIPISEQRLAEYSAADWKCTDCTTHPAKIHVLRAWRPASAEARETPHPENLNIADFNEDDREYLIKFAEQSYFRAIWLPASWVWGAHLQARQHFIKKGPMLALTTEQAVLESYFRVEIVFDVRYSSIVPRGDAEVDLARVGEVTEALVKYQGLGYDDVVWEVPPTEDDEERWAVWKEAYEDWVRGGYVHMPKNTTKKRDTARAKSFERLEKKQQPEYIVGGELMAYQMEGLNWLYYKWHQEQTAILADEMGLGKTIQIISFLSAMVNDLSIWPFLIVVPHSTVPNWKREIQRWCPSMRVVAYFGADKARQLQRKYEMFHHGGKDLKCHVVVTSYTTPLSDSQYLRPIPWEALIVDEGQRLKNDQSLLYKALEGYRIKHKVLMTGTPLQNNPRELFNLLHFLDNNINAKELEEEFGELTRENVPRLHEMIRPFFLRRTKKEVLTFLPPMAEVIVPVTMSSLQRKLYKSILAKDPALIKSIFKNPGDKSKSGNLKNVLVQLRKVLSHPFFYSDDIEDRSFDPATLHKNLIEAGAKFELLNLMLPKLKERGHRVLMFSQFLGMLDVMEDFLGGLGLSYQRLDGGTNTQEKQRRIDAYNAPGSKDFAFLLSTRAGGVGINLATADTVIILDPDFNPHQDIQALSRAHRIGQKNKVLVFHLVTRDTAEEKIMQIGKKKLSLDHLIIEKMGVEGEEEELVDVESVLKFGARALFEDDEAGGEEKRIKYDSEGVDRLLDRSTIEETKTTEVAGAENAFSFARVWANDKGALEEGALGGEESEADMDTGFWDKLLAEREEQARLAAKAAMQELGRGKRKRKVDYSLPLDEFDGGGSPEKGKGRGKVGLLARADGSEDEDFRAEEEPESESDGGMDGVDMMDFDLQQKVAEKRYQDMVGPSGSRVSVPLQFPVPLPWVAHGQPQHRQRVSNLPPDLAAGLPKNYIYPYPVSVTLPYSQTQPQFAPAPVAPMASMQWPQPLQQPKPRKKKKAVDRAYKRVEILPVEDIPGATTKCKACEKLHPPGQCKLKQMGIEHCPLCGIAHYGRGPTCPHINNEENINAMLQALSNSTEDHEMVKDAKQYLRGRKGALRQKAMMDAKNAAQAAAAAVVPVQMMAPAAKNSTAKNA